MMFLAALYVLRGTVSPFIVAVAARCLAAFATAFAALLHCWRFQVPITIAVGAAVLLLSAVWRPLRRALMGVLPAALRARLPAVA